MRQTAVAFGCRGFRSRHALGFPKTRIASWKVARSLIRHAPKAAELDVLLQLYRAQLASYRADAASAARVLHVGESELPPALDPAQLAAWTMVASAILNLDETITKG